MADFFSDLNSLRVDNAEMASSVTETLGHVPVRKPNKQDWFRTCRDPGYRIDTLVFEDKLEREIYFVAPSMRDTLMVEGKLVRLTTCITRQSTVFIWPVTIPDSNGRSSAWNDTAHEALRQAEEVWTRLVADMSLGAYRIFKAGGALSEPVWPDKPFNELLEIAFAGRVIDTPDHAVVRRLRGLV